MAAMLFFISCLCMAFSPSLYFFIAARFAAGIGVGMASMLSPVYIAEVSPANIRGRMVAVNQLTIVIGILVTNVINYSLRNMGDNAWRWMFGLGAIPSGLFFTGALFLPESPRWLVKAGKQSEAQKILAKIGGDGFAASSINTIRQSLSSTKAVGYSAVFKKAVLPAVLTGIVLAVFQQLCGINVVFNYTSSIFASIGVSQDRQLQQTVFIGCVNLVFTLLAMLLVDKLGRKPLMLLGAAGLAVLYVIVANMLSTGSPQVSWFLLGAIGTYAMTLAPVTWILIAEIFPTGIRSAASSVAILALWAAYFILVFSFPPLFERFADHTFYIYAAVCFAGFFFVWARVKETKGKTLEEMDGAMVGH